MDGFNEAHKAGAIETDMQGSVRREARFNEVQAHPSSLRDEGFGQYSRYLGAQFHSDIPCEPDVLRRTLSRAFLPPAADRPRGFDAGTAAINLPPFQSTDSQFPTENFDSMQNPEVRDAWPCKEGQGVYASDSQRPSIVVSNPIGLITAPVADDLHIHRVGDYFTSTITSQDLIKQLYKIVHIINQEWMQKLVVLPDLHEYCSRLSTCTLFSIGIRTLQGCLSGNLPNNFTDTFAFMHVAFAFSAVMNKDCDSYYWDGFYLEIRLWQDAISIVDDLNLFASVRDRLWCPQASAQPRLSAENVTDMALPEVSSTPAVVHKTLGTLEHVSTLADGKGSNSQIPVWNPRQALWNRLMEGMVIKGCSNFLDAIEFATMTERSMSFPAPIPTELEECITMPLQRCPTIAAFKEHVMYAQARLRNGLIRTAHELELTLISCHNWANTNRQAHRRFVDRVASQCDMALGNPYWRNNYYVAHLNLVLGLAGDLELRLRSASSSLFRGRPLSSRLLTRNLQAPSSHSPTSSLTAYATSTNPSYLSTNPAFAVNFDRVVSIPTASSETSPFSMLTNPSAYSTTTADHMALDSRSGSETSSLASSEPTGDVLVCGSCTGKEFHGKYRRRSWKRHIEAEHSDVARIPCPMGCDKTFVPGRVDNVNRHVRKHH